MERLADGGELPRQGQRIVTLRAAVNVLPIIEQIHLGPVPAHPQHDRITDPPLVLFSPAAVAHHTNEIPGQRLIRRHIPPHHDIAVTLPTWTESLPIAPLFSLWN